MESGQILLIQILNQFIYFASGLCFLYALSEIIQAKRQPIHIVRALLLFLSSLLILRGGLYGSDLLVRFPITTFLVITSLYLIGPLNLIYNHFLVDHDRPIPKKTFFLLIPGAIALFLELAFQSQPWSIKHSTVSGIIEAPLQYATTWMMILGVVYLEVFNGLMLYEEIRILADSKANAELKLLVVMNIIGFLSITTSLFGIILIDPITVKIGGMLGCVIYVMDFLARNHYPGFFQEIPNDIKRFRYKRSLKKGLDPAAIFNRLEELMRDHEAYKEPDVSLQNVSARLLIQPHQFSQILNDQYHTTFKDYLNEYRIREALCMLREDKGATVLSICYGVGYNSKSQFNTVFKRITGKSPLEYRQSLDR